MHEWGDRGASPVACLHGVQAHGRRFRRLAEEYLGSRHHVLAVDLRAHGRSRPHPPWNLATHVRDVLETVGEARRAFVGHSFGGRLVLELALLRPGLVSRAVLLDPAVHVSTKTAFALADEERADRSFAGRADALAHLAAEAPRAPHELLEEELEEHLARCDDGRFRFRYRQAAVVAMYGELASQPPAAPSGIPTLLVRGADTEYVREEHVEHIRRGVGDLLEVVTVPGGHGVLWDAFDETAGAVRDFLARS